MKKWNPILKIYEPYSVPHDWNCPLVCFDMDAVVNCASCGREIKFGDSFTSREIHNEIGMGYFVCEKCHENEYY